MASQRLSRDFGLYEGACYDNSNWPENTNVIANCEEYMEIHISLMSIYYVWCE